MQKHISDWMVALSVHLIHFFILTLPTIIISIGTRQWSYSVRWEFLAFSALMILAGIAESVLCAAKSPPTFEAGAPRDKAAITVAKYVGVGMLLLFWVAQIETIVGSSFVDVLRHNFRWQWVTSGIGIMLISLAIVFRLLAMATLGDQFQTDIVCRKVIRRGIYRWCRHPSELGMIGLMVGGTLLLAAPMSLILATLTFVPISFWRIRRENRYLTQIEFS